MSNTKNLKNILDEIRLKRGLTIFDFMKNIGLEQSTYFKYSTGNMFPSTQYQIENTYKVKLLRDEENNITGWLDLSSQVSETQNKYSTIRDTNKNFSAILSDTLNNIPQTVEEFYKMNQGKDLRKWDSLSIEEREKIEMEYKLMLIEINQVKIKFEQDMMQIMQNYYVGVLQKKKELQK